MDWLASLSLYTGICLVTYYLVRYESIRYANNTQNQVGFRKRRCKIKATTMVAIAAMFTLYNVYITTSHGVLSQDRQNYAAEFAGERSVGSTGLQWIFDLVHFFHGDIYTVFYLSTFICVFITLIAYRKSKVADYKLMTLLMASEWIFYTVTTLKQCYSCAFAALFFIYVFRKSNVKNNVICIALAVAAFTFHSTGAILFPIFAAVRINKRNGKRTAFLLFLVFFSILCLRPILLITAEITGSFFPILASKISHYMIEGEGAGEVSIFATIKWMPYYYTAVMGFAYRKGMKKEVDGYDNYLIITVIASGLALFSMVSYWFYRFVSIFYIPVFIYFLLLNNSGHRKRSEWIMNSLIVYGSAILVFTRWFILSYLNFGGF